MGLFRLTGKGGVMIYDNNHWTNEEAREDYLDQTGEEPNKISSTFNFDVCVFDELQRFLVTGSAGR